MGTILAMYKWIQRLVARWAIPIALFIAGMYTYPIALLGPQRDRIPGDLGDARFNNYVLEHFHSFAIGKVDRYWDAPFMYPEKNVVARSDNLLGTAPIYSFFRHMEIKRESAFQSWILAMFALNFWCCFLALKAWSGETIGAACAAFIFAFGIYSIGQMDHAQMLPRFMVPVAFLFTWRYLSSGRPWYLFLTAIAVIYQFYCAIYLGFMLIYALLFLVLGFAIVQRRKLFAALQLKRSALVIAGILLLSAALLAPLMLPYMEVSRTVGARPFQDVIASIPRPASYFFTHPAALSWRDLSEHSKFKFDLWWDHFLFVGAMPWIALIVAIVLLFMKRVACEQRSRMAILLIAFGMSTLFILNIGERSLYQFVHVLPGFSALRALGRSINVQVMFLLFLTAGTIAMIPRRRGMTIVLSIALPILVILDNRIDTGWMRYYDKWHGRNLVDEVARQMTTQIEDPDVPIAYMPLLPMTEKELVHDRVIEINLTAMLAAQQIGVPIVNGYSGSYPFGFMDFFDRMDLPTLAQWCVNAPCDTHSIIQVRDIPMPFLRTDTVAIIAENGSYICANTKRDALAVADRPEPLLWETFRAIQVQDGRWGFRAHNGNFLCAEILQGSQLSATAGRLGDFGLFTIEDLGDGQVALKAHNGLYVSLEPASALLNANSTSIGANERFQIARPDRKNDP